METFKYFLERRKPAFESVIFNIIQIPRKKNDLRYTCHESV